MASQFARLRRTTRRSDINNYVKAQIVLIAAAHRDRIPTECVCGSNENWIGYGSLLSLQWPRGRILRCLRRLVQEVQQV